MGKKFDLRVTIIVDGKARTLFSVKDPPNGEMLVSRKKTDTLRPNGLNPQRIPAIRGLLPRIKEQRYSIHPSHESPDANLLKSTTTVAGGRSFHFHHLTKAIKSGQRYAPLFVQRCPQLDRESYCASTPGLHEISLGSFDPQHYTPYFGVFVAARPNAFTPPLEPSWLMVPINVVQHEFRSIRMVVLWTFLALPSHSSSMASHFVTTPATPERVEGLSSAACCDYFARECWTMEEELRRFMYLDEIRNDPTVPVVIPVQRYFADGTTLTPAAAEYMKMLSMRTINL